MLPRLRHLLVCTDFSYTSWRALSYAATLAKSNKAGLTLMHVLPMLPQEFAYSGVYDLFNYGPGLAGVPPLFPESEKSKNRSREKHPGEFVEKAEQVTKEQLKNHLLQLKSEEPDFNWQSVALKVRVGEPAREILQETESEKYDVVVLGKRGHGRSRSGRSGGVAREVMNNAMVPVFVVDQKRDG